MWHEACILSARADRSDETGLCSPMVMNFLVAQRAAPIHVPPSEGAASAPRSAQSAGAASVRKSFSAVLHTIRQKEGREKAPKSDDAQSLTESNHEGRAERIRTPDDHTSKTDASATESSEVTQERSQDRDGKESADAPQVQPASPTGGTNVQSDSQSVLLTIVQVATTGPVTTQPVDLEPVSPERGLSYIENDETATEQPVTVRPTTKGLSQSDIPVVPTKGQSEQSVGMPAIHREHDSRTGQISDRETQAHVDGVDELPAEYRKEVSPVPPQDEQRPPIQHPGASHDQGFQVYQELMTKDSELSGSTTNSDRTIQGIPLERSVPLYSETHAQPLSGHENLDAWPSFFDGGQQSDAQWSDRSGRSHDHEDISRFPQASFADLKSHTASGQSAERFAVGAATQSLPGPPAAPVASFIPQTQSVRHSHNQAEWPMPAMTRSVVFEVAQPDLGRVNVRVAMTNEMVHAHLSSDRSEVGQFLLNGQDRLQAALQANGLEMGQFRVDLDRQSAGRSFQQEHPQDQKHTWHWNPGHVQGDSATEFHDVRPARPRGMLNLVA